MSNGWSDAELAAAVEAYEDMLRRDAAGEKVNKAQVYRDLAAQFVGRADKAFEYRMQNISALYAELGLPWLAGLKPAVNVGREMKPRLLKLIQRANAKSVGFKHGSKRTWELVLEALDACAGNATREQVKDWIVSHYPGYNEKNLVDLEMLAVNSKSRTSYNQNAKPRLTDTGSPYDRLYKMEAGREARFVTYHPISHGVWEVYPDAASGNHHRMSVRKVTDPTAKVLEEARAEAESTGAFSPADITDARRRVLAQIVRRQGQAGFRDALIKAYEGRCAITGCMVERILEAAHVVPYQGEATNVAANGLLLRSDIHTLFDLNLLTLDPATMTVKVSPELSGSEYATLQGKAIFIPTRPADRVSVEALTWHQSQCLW
ncbi:HNH endonuclease [Pseudomonas luteola]|nr:HNH endonuclease [Pseudomonas luteola]QEU26255.1 HNH endonuclease [Pseudomonas luteola]